MLRNDLKLWTSKKKNSDKITELTRHISFLTVSGCHHGADEPLRPADAAI